MDNTFRYLNKYIICYNVFEREDCSMSLKHFIVALGLLSILFGCKVNSTGDLTPPGEGVKSKLKYNYQLHTSNYQDIIEIKTTHLEIEDEQSRIELKIKLMDKSDVAEGIKVDFTLITVSKIFPDSGPNTRNFKIEFSGTNEYTYIVKYSIFQLYEDLEITNISGIVKSNQDYGPRNPYEESKRYRESLLSEIEAVLHDDLLKLNIYQSIQTQSPYYYQNIFSATNIDLESFYYSTLVNLTDGTIITEKDDKYYIYRYFTDDYQPYLQLVSVMDDLHTVDTDSSPAFDFSDTWFYSYQNGVYKIEAKLGEIIRLAITDESLIDQIFSKEDLDIKVNMEITVTEERITFKIMYRISQTDVTIKTYYNPNRVDRMDMSSVIKVPMNSPQFITEYTDITQPLTNQAYVSEVPNYYLVHLEGGAYAFSNPDGMLLEFFDTDLKPVPLVKDPRFSFQTRFKNVYNFEAGDYLVKVSSSAVGNFNYSLQLIALDEVYKSVIDISNPILITDTPVEIEIEGYYDYVLALFSANEEGLLFLAGDKPFDGKVYTLESDGSIKDNRVTKNDLGIYVFLYPGENLILFENSYNKEKVIFTPDAHGIRSEKEGILPEEFQSEFLVSRPYEEVYLRFQVTEPSLVNFEAIRDPVFGIAKTREYQIWMENKYGRLELKQSFSMIDSKELYLPAGNYAIRVMGLSSIKLKGTITPTPPITEVTAEIPTLNQIALYESNPSMYRKIYDQYPYETLTINFILTETTHLLFGADNYLAFTLMDSNNKTINFTRQDGNQIYVLNAGTYRVFFEKNEEMRNYERSLALIRITDPIVLADENLYRFNDISNLEFGVEYTYTKAYKADSEIGTFTITETSTLRFSTNVYMFYVIVDQQGKTIGSGNESKDFTLEAGTYTVLINYMYDMSVGKSVIFEIDYL